MFFVFDYFNLGFDFSLPFYYYKRELEVLYIELGNKYTSALGLRYKYISIY